MDKKYNCQTWFGNMFQRFETVFHEVDEYVNRDTVNYVESHMQTVGESVKRFYSGVVQEFLPPSVEPVHHVAELIPSEQTHVVETYTTSVVDIKEDTIDCNTNKSEEGSVVPTEICQELSITGLCHSEKISSGCPIGDADSNSYVENEGRNPINKTSDKAIQVHLNSSTSNQGNFVVEQSSCKDASSPEHKNSSEEVIYSGRAEDNHDDDHSAKISHESSKNRYDNRFYEDNPESSVFEDLDWGIEDIIDVDSVVDKVIEGEPSPFPSEDVNILANRNLIAVPFVEETSEMVPLETLVTGLNISCPQEKETLLNRSIDEFRSDLNTSNTHQSSKLESSITCNENKEESKSYDSSSSSFRSFLADPYIIYSDSPELLGCFSASSLGLSSCESLGAIVHDNNDSTRLASSSCTRSDDTTRTGDAVCGTGLCSSEHGCYDNLPQLDTYLSCSEFGADDSSMVDDEFLKMDTIDLSDEKQHTDTIDLSNNKQLAESCVIVEGQNLLSHPYKAGKSKCYKKIIQDAFMLRKSLTQEYKELAIWYGDIDQVFSQLTEENTLPISTPKSRAQDLPDSEWELV